MTLFGLALIGLAVAFWVMGQAAREKARKAEKRAVVESRIVRGAK